MRFDLQNYKIITDEENHRKEREVFYMKKLIALLLVASMTFSLAACATESESDVPDTEEVKSNDIASGKYEWPLRSEVVPDDSRTSTANSDKQYDSINVAVSSVPADLSPYTMSNAITNMEIFDTLVEQDENGEYVGRIAKNWYEKDDTHFIVELYDYVFDTDGNNITASDVAFSFDTFANSGFARDFNYYDSCNVIDEYTVEFVWKEPITGLTNLASMLTKTYICSEKAYTDHDFVNDPVGSGPYSVRDYVTSSYVVLEAKDDYWQTDESLEAPNAARNVKTIRYDFISDNSMSAVAFENGDTINVALNADTIELFEEGGEYADLGNLYCYPDTVSITAVPNMSSDSLMSDLNLRLAVFYALDTEAFADALGARLYSPVTTDASPAIADYSNTWTDEENYQNVYDPELAAEYLKKSDYNGETLTILLEANDQKSSIAAVMQAYLDAVGIKTEITTYDHAMIAGYASMSDGWDIFLASSGDAEYTANRIRKVYGSNAGYAKGLNISLYENDEFQKMIDNANTIEGNSESATQKILDYIYDNALGYGTAYVVNVECYSKCVARIVNKYGNIEIIYGACDYYLD